MKSSQPSYGYALLCLLFALYGIYQGYYLAFVPAEKQTFSCDRGANACVLHARREAADVDPPKTFQLDTIASAAVTEHTWRRSTHYRLELRLKSSDTVSLSDSTADDETLAELRKASRAIEAYLADATAPTFTASWTLHASPAEVAGIFMCLLIFGPCALILASGKKEEPDPE